MKPLLTIILLCISTIIYCQTNIESQNLMEKAIESFSESEKDWREYLEPLYKEIKPTSGILFHELTNNHWTENDLGNLYIVSFALTFDEITYLDPFYDNIETKAIEFWIGREKNKMNVNSLHDIQNKVYSFDSLAVRGRLSNSIHIVLHKIKFGEIKDKKLKITLDYSYTNSYGYPMLNGTIQDHCELRGSSEVEVKIFETAIYEDNWNYGDSDQIISKYVNPKYYDIQKKEKTNRIDIYDGHLTFEDDIFYKIPIKF